MKKAKDPPKKIIVNEQTNKIFKAVNGLINAQEETFIYLLVVVSDTILRCKNAQNEV